MKIDHIHFYVEDAGESRDWFIQKMGFKSVASGVAQNHCTEVIRSGAVDFVLSSPLTNASPIAQFLTLHPPGVVDVAFQVQNLRSAVTQAAEQGAEVLQPIHQMQLPQGSVRWSQIAAWGTLRHTLLERSGVTPLLPTFPELEVSVGESELESRKAVSDDRALAEKSLPLGEPKFSTNQSSGIPFTGIDHVVLNVARGDLERAIAWYVKILGFQPQQMFEIQTNHSGLCSQVLVHPQSRVQLPINEPTSASSQIQEFLDVNRAPGVQHIALHTENIVGAIAQLRRAGLPLLEVPPTYYTQLKQRQQFRMIQANWQAIEAQQILVDWQAETPQAMLLQTFTQPIFKQPTFFFELIERQPDLSGAINKRAEGFGEGNFRALFEAIEQEQMKRGSLK